jgi:hypothetical protein
MRSRAPIISIISLAVLAVPCTALATDSPAPGGAPGGVGGASGALQAAPSVASMQAVLSKCSDKTKPTSSFTAKAARSAARTHVLRGRAADVGCGVAMVTVSIARTQGKRCQPVTSKGRLGHTGRCTAKGFLVATGTSNWHITLPKGLPKGTYLVRTRAIDFAGNVQSLKTRRITLG